MPENHWSTGGMRNTPLIITLGVVALAVVAAIVYFAGGFSHGAAQGENAAKVAVKADNGDEAKKPRFPFMRLEAQYAGPFQDTVIQRWRDPIDGRVCYLYIPVRVKHEPVKNKNEIVDYGRNTIGSISCSGPVMVRRPPPTPAPKADAKPKKSKK